MNIPQKKKKKMNVFSSTLFINILLWRILLKWDASYICKIVSPFLMKLNLTGTKCYIAKVLEALSRTEILISFFLLLFLILVYDLFIWTSKTCHVFLLFASMLFIPIPRGTRNTQTSNTKILEKPCGLKADTTHHGWRPNLRF